MEGEEINEDGNSPPVVNRRTYDCEICKRGFTNAQALGGHMNIHRNLNLNRKERSKSKNNNNLISSSSSSSSSSYSPHTNPNYTLSPSYFPIQMNNRDPPMNPSYIGHYGRGGLDLSLRLGSINVYDESQRRRPEIEAEKPQDDDLDLELRLGHRR